MRERRQELRYPCNVEVLWCPVADPKCQGLAAHTKDISENGIRVVVPQLFEPGTLADVQIRDQRHNLSLSRLVLVIHSQPESEGKWSLGGEFHNELTYEELEALRG